MYTHKSLSIYSLFALLTLVSACSEEQDVIQEIAPAVGYEGVAEDLWPYFERFEEEAQRRGIDVDLRAARITGQVQEIAQSRVLGQCNYQRFNHNRVTIDETFWNRTSDLGKEFVVFHELGHCFLLRDHVETAFTNGTCTSIMRSGTGTCRDSYGRSTRDVYLEELFDTRLAGDIVRQ